MPSLTAPRDASPTEGILMSLLSRSAMAEVLRLTRGGNLAGATSQILAGLTGQCARAPLHPVRDGGDLIPHQDVLAPPLGAGQRDRDARPSGPPARFETRAFRHANGSLDYRLYVPANAAPGMPLVVMLHGCTQSPDDFARGTRMNALADELGFLVAYPGQTSAANPQKCWNWFSPGNQQRDGGEPALVAGIARQVIAGERVDAGRVYVAGLSAGGAAAAVLAEAYPDIFAAVGIHSGLGCGAATSVSGALMAMRGTAGKVRVSHGSFVPVITFHGDRDQTVHETNSGAIIAAATASAARGLRATSERGMAPGGRSFTRDMLVDDAGDILIERWTVHGCGHAWSGGDAAGSYTDPRGPDASRAMLRFFLTHRHGRRAGT
jgi:poly(hydroxyalkanoate) depolymerase family esterase